MQKWKNTENASVTANIYKKPLSAARDVARQVPPIEDRELADAEERKKKALADWNFRYKDQIEQQKMANEKACDFCKGRAYTKKPVTIITAYGKRFQMVFEHCPNCGRKLRKENEDGK